MNQDLNALALQYGSDKTPAIKHHYTQFYEAWLLPRQDTIRKLVEIGIGYEPEMFPGYKPGASLRMWRDYLPQAQIFGADIRPELLFSEPRITTFRVDQGNPVDLAALLDHTGLDVDVFIDDGSHLPRHQVETCAAILPHLWARAIYFIEDVSRPDWVSRQLHLRGIYTEVLEAPQRRHKDDRMMRVWL